ncbi:hypothetical protein BDZ94DRAFT_1324241 [Collybia nuda]|uniref:DUF6699 domain-containing protein n=1 Tax=Collybia nuda TaxID=64659 RepID=A0A9P5XZY1_9AGAR|nr:hypothetical protein BDZ94DRAFT_1324241 [Collybia nuda]
MYHQSTSSLKSSTSNHGQAPPHVIQSPSSWSSLPWVAQNAQPQSGRESVSLSPKYPVVFIGETPSHQSIPLSPYSTTSANTPAQLVHPLLERDTSGRIQYNIAHHPSYIQFRTPVSPQSEQAFYPPITRARIRVPGLPAWSFNAENPQGVTLLDVFNAIYANLHRPVGQSEFAKLPPPVQHTATAGHAARTAANRADFMQGVKRLDCLYPNSLFVGLSLSSDGSGAWNLSLVSRYH